MADEQNDLLGQIESTFYGGGQAQPIPSPTPTPTPQPRAGRFSMTDRMDKALGQALQFNRPSTSAPQDLLTAAMRAPMRFAGLQYKNQSSPIRPIQNFNPNLLPSLTPTPTPSGFDYIPKISADQLAEPPDRLFHYQYPKQFDVVPLYTF